MADETTDLPEGNDKVIAGASTIGPNEAELTDTGNTTKIDDSEFPDAKANAGSATAGSVIDKVRTGGGKLSDQAAGKARDLVGQGLERSAEALASVSKLVGDTAAGLDERLGAEYGDYARRAATAIDDAANSIASKDADELIDDTREFVRRSPGVALAGAAIVGFALARLIKTGLAKDDDRGGKGRGRSRGSRES